jgi:hypothetical protein
MHGIEWHTVTPTRGAARTTLRACESQTLRDAARRERALLGNAYGFQARKVEGLEFFMEQPHVLHDRGDVAAAGRLGLGRGLG